MCQKELLHDVNRASFMLFLQKLRREKLHHQVLQTIKGQTLAKQKLYHVLQWVCPFFIGM